MSIVHVHITLKIGKIVFLFTLDELQTSCSPYWLFRTWIRTKLRTGMYHGFLKFIYVCIQYNFYKHIEMKWRSFEFFYINVKHKQTHLCKTRDNTKCPIFYNAIQIHYLYIVNLLWYSLIKYLIPDKNLMIETKIAWQMKWVVSG